LPSKDPEVKKRAQKRYRESVKGRARRKVMKAAWDKSARGKALKAESDKKWRKTATYKALAAEKMRNWRQKRKAWLREIKSKLSCAECGFDKHPAALQFHHLGDKIDGVTKLVCNTSKSYAFIREEMAKCVVLCANCHLILHDEEHEDRVRARDMYPWSPSKSEERLRPSPNQNAQRVKRPGIRLGKGTSNGKSVADYKHDHEGGNSTLRQL